MHFQIEQHGTVTEVTNAVGELPAITGTTPEDVATMNLHKYAKGIIMTTLSGQDPARKCEVIAYGSVGNPPGSLSLSIKIEG